MRESLIRFLVCPACSQDLTISDASIIGNEIKEGNLQCRGCGQVYPITNYIPRFVPKPHYHLFRETWRNFGFSWRRFARIYSDPRDFLDWIKPVTPDFFKGKTVVDAGCGTGMHACFAAEFGATDVVAFDLSSSVEVARENTAHLPQVHVIQADIYHLPLKADFDYVYTIGVLQHLPDPALGFLNLVRLLRKGGCLSIWVYGFEGTGFVRYVVDPIRRLTSKMPLPLVYMMSFAPTALVFLLTRIMRSVRNRLASRGQGELLRRIPLGEYLAYMSQFNFHYLHNSIFDQLIAPITKYFHRQEVENWFRQAGLKNVEISSRNQISWRGFGQRVEV